MATSKPSSQQGGSHAPAQQQGQQQGTSPQQQQGTAPVFKDWAAI